MRILRLLLVPAIAAALVAALLLSVRSGGGKPAQAAAPHAAAALPASPTAASPTAAPPASVPSPAVSAAAPAAASSSAPAPGGFVALVDGEAITPAQYVQAAAIDAAMSTLLNTDPTTPTQLVEQLINHRLVLRAAAAAGAGPSNPGRRLAALLAAHGKVQADLDALLRARSVSPAQFETYLGELVLADEFSRAEAARQGATVDAYVASLRQTAGIRYGDLPAAAAAVRSPAETPTQIPTETPTEARGVLAGQLAPQFELPVLGQESTTSLADLLGTPTVLSFWTTWCPYCLRQTPVMVAAAARYAPEHVQFAGIDVSEQADVVAAYVAEHGIPYPILLDERGEAAAAYAVEGYPTTLFLDAEGRIAARHIGALSEQQLTQYVEQLLAAQ